LGNIRAQPTYFMKPATASADNGALATQFHEKMRASVLAGETTGISCIFESLRRVAHLKSYEATFKGVHEAPTRSCSFSGDGSTG
jgi:hypothetical protein